MSSSRKFRCINEHMGCTTKVTKDDIGTHLKTCAYGLEPKKKGNTIEDESFPESGGPLSLYNEGDHGSDSASTADPPQPQPPPKSSNIFSKLGKLHPRNLSASFSTRLKSKTPNLIKTPADLRSLGTMDSISRTNPVYEKISKYAQNGVNIHGDSRVELKINEIFQFSKSYTNPSPDQPELLLWFKTTRKSVTKLESKEDGCISFFDRIARAVAINPREMKNKKPIRQMVILCSVDVGKEFLSPHVYQHWRHQSPPQGYNSVKTMGKYAPDENAKIFLNDNSPILIPSGETTKNEEYSEPEYETDFNEYIIYESSRAKLMYAVDIEIIRSEKAGDEIEMRTSEISENEDFSDESDSD